MIDWLVNWWNGLGDKTKIFVVIFTLYCFYQMLFGEYRIGWAGDCTDQDVTDLARSMGITREAAIEMCRSWAEELSD